MTLEEFIDKKQPVWSELETLLKRGPRRHIGSATPTQLNQLGYLYRRVTSDLAVARRDFPDDRCVPYLNTLASRAHSGIYQSSPLKRNTIRQFFGSGFPTLFRSNLGFISAAFLLFTLGFAATYWLALANPQFAEKLAPEDIVDTIHEKEMWTNIPELQRNLAASFIMTNNIRVAFLAFASGIMYMVGTVYILAIQWCTHRHDCGAVPRAWARASTLDLCVAARLYRIDDNFYRRRCGLKNGVRADWSDAFHPETRFDRCGENCGQTHRRLCCPACHRRGD